MAEKLIKASPYLKIPPQSIEAEMALLGSIMLRPDTINEVMDVVNFRSFYAEKHRIIFRGMLEFSGNQIRLIFFLFLLILRDKGMLDQIGGASYLTELVNTVPSAANVKHYAEIVQKKNIMRNLNRVR
jgi:replicative DNA helicase